MKELIENKCFVIQAFETTEILTDILINGHSVQRTEKSMRIQTFCSTDIMFYGYTVQWIYKNSSDTTTS